MSIAVSVVVKSSNLLFVLVAAICSGAAVTGLQVGMGSIGELPAWLRIICTSFCFLFALAGLVNTARRRKTYHVDISGAGQIRLHADGIDGDGLLVKLLADSTIWPHFLLLRLRGEDGSIHIVPILQDCLPKESFRAISVACRWIAAHNLTQRSSI